jgi:hypothetical protein
MTTIQQHNNQPRTMALGGDIQAMFGSADSSFEFKHKRFREAHAENKMPENWLEIQKWISKADNLLKSLWRGIKADIDAGKDVNSKEIDDATKIRDDMLECVKRAKQFINDANFVFSVAEHRCKDRSVPPKAIEMLQLKNMAGGVVKISKEYEAAWEAEEARCEEEENAHLAEEVAQTSDVSEDDGELLNHVTDAARVKDHELFAKGTQYNAMRTRKVRTLKPAEKPWGTSTRGLEQKSTSKYYKKFMSSPFVSAFKQYPSPESTDEPIQFSSGYLYCVCCNGIQIPMKGLKHHIVSGTHCKRRKEVMPIKEATVQKRLMDLETFQKENGAQGQTLDHNTKDF